MHPLLGIGLRIGTALLALALSACGESPAVSSAPSAEPTQQPSSDRRIISLSPAISRTLIDFQLQGAIVGRTPHCASLDQSIPAVGDLLNVNYEQIIRLQPTHVLLQPQGSGADRKLLQLASEHGWKIGQWKLDNCSDISALIRELPAVLFARGTAQREEAERRAAELQREIEAAMSPGEAPVFRGSVMFVHSVSTVSVFGTGTYLDDILKSLGGTNAVSGKDWLTLSLEDVVRLSPEAIILVQPGAAGIDPKTAAGPMAELDIPAVRQRRIAVLTHPDSLMPCSGVIGVASELRSILQQLEAANK